VFNAELLTAKLDPRPPPPKEWIQQTSRGTSSASSGLSSDADPSTWDHAAAEAGSEHDAPASRITQSDVYGGVDDAVTAVKQPQQLWKSPRKLEEWRRQRRASNQRGLDKGI